MPNDDSLTPPEKDVRDLNYQLKGAILSAFPLVKEFYETVVEPPFQKRTIAWMNKVAEKCREFEAKFTEFKPENLVNNEVFQSAFISASRIAIQSYQKGKLEALSNALLNTVIMKGLEENFKLLFFSYIESMTVLHLDVVKFFENFREGIGSLDKVYDVYFKKYMEERKSNVILNVVLFTSLCRDLENKGLIMQGIKKFEDRDVSKRSVGFFQLIQQTALGKQFYQFILAPKADVG